MQLSALAIPESKEKQLKKAGIKSVEDLLLYFPRKYIDRTALTGIHTPDKESVLLVHVNKVRKTSSMILIAECVDTYSKTPLQVKWFNQVYLYPELIKLSGKEVLVAGQVQLNRYNGIVNYEINAPAVFDPDGVKALGIYPVYKKVPGMAEEYLRSCIQKAASLLTGPEEIAPLQFLRDLQLMDYPQMIRQLHWPESKEQLDQAQHRKLMNELLYFALRVELNYRGVAIGSPFGIPMIRKTTAIRNSLPFQLTPDQANTVDGILAWIRTGRRVNALIQGDVGCGKTIVAFLLMTALAENGYQAALMAPTQILAQQHYEELVKLVEPYGLKVAFVSGQKLKKVEQTALEKTISEGEVELIVGTQALLSSTYQFKNLAMVIEDEEHKYGVMQRQALIDKAACGTHTVTMSATPIPRSLALTIYGENVQLYSIQSKPAGRLPVKTGIQPKREPVFRYLQNAILGRGEQAYVVCPMVKPSDKVVGVSTVEEVYELYKKALEPYGIHVAAVTGKTKKAEAQQIIRDFTDNKTSVLVSTTVIEVGVNVPNATCIVIHNAERFGLAQLHQLRGRVGRGKKQAYCVLSSGEIYNPRLQAMCNHTDGFEIAKIDLELRGAGDILGSQQSGTEKLLRKALENQPMYLQAQNGAKWILENGIDCLLLEQAMEDQKNNIGGEIETER